MSQSVLAGFFAGLLTASIICPSYGAGNANSSNVAIDQEAQLTPPRYELSPNYRKFIQPYILDKTGFDALTYKFHSQKKFSDKDNIDALIQLGVVANKPEWLTAETKSKISYFYPTLNIKKGEYISTNNKYALNNFTVSTDDIAQVPVSVPLLVFTVASIGVMAVLVHDNPQFKPLTSYLTAEVNNMMDDAMKSSYPPDDLPVNPPTPQITDQRPKADTKSSSVIGNNSKCTPEEEDRLNKWYHNICDNTDSCNGNYTPERNKTIKKAVAQCLSARAHAADVCFEGKFDARHDNTMTKFKNRLDRCNRIISEQSKPQPDTTVKQYDYRMFQQH